MKRVRVAFVAVPRLVRDALAAILASASDIDLLAEYDSPVAFSAAAELRADVLVTASGALPEAVILEVLRAHPSLHVVAIDGRGSTGLLYELRPGRTCLRELSAQLFLDLLRKRRPPGFAIVPDTWV